MCLDRRRDGISARGLFCGEGPTASELSDYWCRELRGTRFLCRCRRRRRMAGDGVVSGTPGVICSSANTSLSEELRESSKARVKVRWTDEVWSTIVSFDSGGPRLSSLAAAPSFGQWRRSDGGVTGRRRWLRRQSGVRLKFVGLKVEAPARVRPAGLEGVLPNARIGR
ncbi:hypothetical protein EYF80_019781 [Liparis tanakae]|uniref:Uncharacterized protein n=1 Tax=Liparis tanakae TaxID=230148 RepID=A0A4Z2HW51_9TELE|nr:hypothetical protein EYF80_019781 [Liparis tanakae]